MTPEDPYVRLSLRIDKASGGGRLSQFLFLSISLPAVMNPNLLDFRVADRSDKGTGVCILLLQDHVVSHEALPPSPLAATKIFSEHGGPARISKSRV